MLSSADWTRVHAYHALNQAEARLREIASQKDDSISSRLILSPEELAERDKWQEEKAATNKRLREVRHSLNKDIEALGFWDNGFRHLPVVEHGRPLGIVSARDALDDDLYELRVDLAQRGDERD